MTRFEQIWENYLSDRLTAEEASELQQWLLQQEDQVPAAIDRLLAESSLATVTDAAYKEEVFNRMMQRVSKPAPLLSLKSWWYIAAAAVLLFAIAGIYLFTPGRKTTETITQTADIKAPQSVRAMLTLANGEKIYLDSAGSGLLATEGAVRISRSVNGQLQYETTKASGSSISYNLLSNPRGSRVISVTLSDGTSVWLNNESSIRYPASFTDNERVVTVTGEAYFEVAYQATKGGKKIPFRVNITSAAGIDKGSVNVLGTWFNVNAYEEEQSVNVSLVQGSVQVNAATPAQSVLIKPGEQAQVFATKIQATDKIDLPEIMAWKNGYFQFTDADIQTVMRQLERWYDLEVVFEGKIPTDRFGGKLPRDVNVSEILKALEQTQVHFTVAGKKIIVRP